MSDIMRERFRKALADLGHAEATFFSHWALEAYDMVHCPELRAPKAIVMDIVNKEPVVIKRNGKIVYQD